MTLLKSQEETQTRSNKTAHFNENQNYDRALSLYEFDAICESYY